MRIIDRLNDKKILIWGYGREGKATESFINKHCRNVKYDIYEGNKEGFDDSGYDYVIKSPGIPYITDDPKYISETSMFVEEFKEQIIAVTGTKGKSTTSSLLYKVLRDLNKDTILVGNIGNPCFDYYDQINKDTVIVFEISAHQLVTVKTSPHIGVFINLYEEHLDYYKTLDNYFNAKANIGKYQNENDYLLVGTNVPEINTKANKIVIENKEKFNLKIIGEHNQYNANFVYYIAINILKLDKEKVINSMCSFTNLKHRIDFVGKINGIDYYDDSISTIPQATINAINSIPNVKTVLIGGMDRKINYDVLVDYIKTHELNYIFMYASGKVIYDQVKDLKYCYLVDTLENAVVLAKKITSQNQACLLSPAAASYDSFKNFEERGDCFIKLIKE